MKTKIKLLLVLFLSASVFSLNAKKVHTIGDSTMAQYDESATNTRGWAMYLQQYLTGVTVNNRGKAGASSKSFYNDAAYWQSVKKQMVKGDYLIIQFSHNDETNNGADGEAVKAYYQKVGKSTANSGDFRGTCPYSTYKEYLRKYVNEARAMGVTPIFMGSICRMYFSNNTITRTGQHDLGDKYTTVTSNGLVTTNKVASTNHTMDYMYQMKAVAKELNVPFLDLTTATENLYLKYGDTQCHSLLSDGKGSTHLCERGAKEIAQLAANLINGSGVLNSSSTETSTTTTTTNLTGIWDFQNMNPSSLKGMAFEGNQGHLSSTNSQITMFVIAKEGKFKQRTNDAQFNANTCLRIPVKSTADRVIITSDAGFHNYTIGGVAATANTTSHTATSAEVSAGYVEVKATAASYLQKITVIQKVATTATTDKTTTNTNTSSFKVVNQNYYIVAAGSASSFLAALKQANTSNTSASASRTYIFLPDGTYDLGSTCLTAITGNNISIIGQSMDKTIIKNTPAQEGIGVTATLLNKGSNTYFQNLTLKNAYPFSNTTGRAVCLQDQGTRTICKNVKLLSYQDTYYSNNRSGQYYFENSDIHGVVDFICGGGDAYFNKCTLSVESRNTAVIAAPYTESTWGYVFNGCTINNNATQFSLARSWGANSSAVYINTVMNTPTKIISTRFTPQGMNTIAYKFLEYHSVNTNGAVVSPSSNKVTFYIGSTKSTKETVMSSSDAGKYTLSNIFGSWNPAYYTSQLTMGALSQNGNKLSWKSVSGASSYAVFRNGSLLTIVGSSTTSYNMSKTGTYAVSASNEMGGFGTQTSLNVTSLGSTANYDLGTPVGWATVGGSVTGSSNKNTVVVTTVDEFNNAMAGTGAKTVYVKGNITFSSQLTINGAANKTVLGLPGSALENSTHTNDAGKTGILCLKNCKNIILRNLTFKGPGAYDIDGCDNLTVTSTDYLWVDHCDFQDGVDGNFDCNHGSDHIAVTWCRFRYLKAPWAGGSGGSNDHRFSDLWGSGDKVTESIGKLRTTFADCWWDEGCKQRMPRVRFGQIHIVNCLYSSSVADYCIGAGYLSNIYVENTAFTSSKAQATPWMKMATTSGYTDYNIAMTGCYGANDMKQCSGSNSYFNLYSHYSYTAYPAASVENVVKAKAGATLSISSPASAAKASLGFDDDSETTGITSVDGNAEQTVTLYFDLAGKQLEAPVHGMNIVKVTSADGSVKVKKMMIK
jgi:pectate lyase